MTFDQFELCYSSILLLLLSMSGRCSSKYSSYGYFVLLSSLFKSNSLFFLFQVSFIIMALLTNIIIDGLGDECAGGETTLAQILMQIFINGGGIFDFCRSLPICSVLYCTTQYLEQAFKVSKIQAYHFTSLPAGLVRTSAKPPSFRRLSWNS